MGEILPSAAKYGSTHRCRTTRGFWNQNTLVGWLDGHVVWSLDLRISLMDISFHRVDHCS